MHEYGSYPVYWAMSWCNSMRKGCHMVSTIPFVKLGKSSRSAQEDIKPKKYSWTRHTMAVCTMGITTLQLPTRHQVRERCIIWACGYFWMLMSICCNNHWSWTFHMMCIWMIMSRAVHTWPSWMTSWNQCTYPLGWKGGMDSKETDFLQLYFIPSIMYKGEIKEMQDALAQVWEIPNIKDATQWVE